MYFSQFVGVDISKNTLDAAIYPAKDKKLDLLHFDNRKVSERCSHGLSAEGLSHPRW